MKRSWDLRPDLRDCILEERIVPATLGVIVQTTNGLALVTPFPGAINLSAMAGGGAVTSAASVSGTAMPTSFYMTSRGISSFTPGNFTGNPNIGSGGAVGTSGGVSITIQVGSGADQAGGPVSTTQASSRTNPADNGNRAPILAHIGSVGSGSGTMASGGDQATPTAPAPVPPLPPVGVVIPGSPTGPHAGGSTPTNPMNPQLGAPRLVRGLGASLIPSLPGGLGVGTNPNPPGPGY